MPYFPPKSVAATVGDTKLALAANQSNSTLTAAGINNLQSPVIPANSLVLFRYHLIYNTAVSTTNVVLRVETSCTSITYVRYSIRIQSSISAFVWNSASAAFNTTVTGTGSQGATNLAADIWGVAQYGAASGWINADFASSVNASAVTINQGSYGVVTF